MPVTTINPIVLSNSRPYEHHNRPPGSIPPVTPEPEAGVTKKGGKSGKDGDGPVKSACLSCRRKKAKCDGAQPCGLCQKKNLECLYVKSKRGGARKKKAAELPAPSVLLKFLANLDRLVSIPNYNLSPARSESPLSNDTKNIVRLFTSREEIFRCYYSEVHPYMTVMPPRHYLSDILPRLQTESPFLLAAQAIMTLVPHLQDPHPESYNSKRLRRAASENLATQTMRAIDDSINTHGPTLESVQALVMLGLWQWGNAANLDGSREFCRRSLEMAMQMGLHELDQYREYDHNSTFSDSDCRSIEGIDWEKDMARRTWWTVYINQLTGALVSGQPPLLDPDDPRVKVDFPVCSVSDQSWPRWINVSRHCSRAFAKINNLMYSYYGESSQRSWGTHTFEHVGEEVREGLKAQVHDLDRSVVQLMKDAEAEAIIDLVPGGEQEVCRNQQLSARFGIAVTHIHIHRHQAFPEVTLFSKKICGLPKPPKDLQQNISQPNNPNSSHYSILNQVYGPAWSNANLTSSVDSSPVVSNSYPAQTLANEFNSDLWQPETYPAYLPTPWFAQPNGAASLYVPEFSKPVHAPILQGAYTINPPETLSAQFSRPYMPAPFPSPQAYITNIANYPTPPDRFDSMTPPLNGSNLDAMSISPRSGQDGGRSGSISSSVASKVHRAWGVDDETGVPLIPKKPEAIKREDSDEADDDDEIAEDLFPPGISLARCTTAAHTIVRLEVLHHSASVALEEGTPKWLPFCACALVSGAYSFLLLAVAVLSENGFGQTSIEIPDQFDRLLTNVRSILEALEAYGTMWAGIDVMAGEVRAAWEAAQILPEDLRRRWAARLENQSNPDFDNVVLGNGNAIETGIGNLYLEGTGNGYSTGSGSGSGYVNGSAIEYGNGFVDGTGNGYASGSGNGYVDGTGDEYASGSGNG